VFFAYFNVFLHVYKTKDFVKQDVQKLYPALYPYVTITVVEAGPVLLGPFDKALQDYAYQLFQKRDITVKLGTAVIGVEDYTPDTYRFNGKRAILSDGNFIEFGTMIWSAGLAPRNFIEELQKINTTTSNNKHKFLLHPRSKRLLIDDCLRVKGHEGTIWAMGDCAVNESGIPLPQLAQVARQQGMYLADVLSKKKSPDAPFQFFSLGSMAFVGELKGIYDGTTAGPLRSSSTSTGSSASSTSKSITDMVLTKVPSIKGLAALVLWRFAYWGRQTSIANKILIPVHWFKTFFFGRDTSRY
jgi:NADH dehydrogenase FAD-containing subunit